MLESASEFGSPSVRVSVISNTQKEDLGLKIADFRVTPPTPA